MEVMMTTKHTASSSSSSSSGFRQEQGRTSSLDLQGKGPPNFLPSKEEEAPKRIKKGVVVDAAVAAAVMQSSFFAKSAVWEMNWWKSSLNTRTYFFRLFSWRCLQASSAFACSVLVGQYMHRIILLGEYGSFLWISFWGDLGTFLWMLILYHGILLTEYPFFSIGVPARTRRNGLKRLVFTDIFSVYGLAFLTAHIVGSVLSHRALQVGVDKGSVGLQDITAGIAGLVSAFLFFFSGEFLIEVPKIHALVFRGAHLLRHSIDGIRRAFLTICFVFIIGSFMGLFMLKNKVLTDVSKSLGEMMSLWVSCSLFYFYLLTIRSAYTMFLSRTALVQNIGTKTWTSSVFKVTSDGLSSDAILSCITLHQKGSLHARFMDNSFNEKNRSTGQLFSAPFIIQRYSRVLSTLADMDSVLCNHILQRRGLLDELCCSWGYYQILLLSKFRNDSSGLYQDHEHLEHVFANLTGVVDALTLELQLACNSTTTGAQMGKNFTREPSTILALLQNQLMQLVLRIDPLVLDFVSSDPILDYVQLLRPSMWSHMFAWIKTLERLSPFLAWLREPLPQFSNAQITDWCIESLSNLLCVLKTDGHVGAQFVHRALPAVLHSLVSCRISIEKFIDAHPHPKGSFLLEKLVIATNMSYGTVNHRFQSLTNILNFDLWVVLDRSIQKVVLNMFNDLNACTFCPEVASRLQLYVKLQA